MLKKFFWPTILTVLFVALLCIGNIMEEKRVNPREDDSLSFSLQAGHDKFTVRCWEKDGEFTVFLPSFARLNQMTVSCSAPEKMSLDGINLLNGMPCKGFELNKKYSFKGESFDTTLRFVQSANVATMFINTFSGNMESVHADKYHKEQADITILTQEGENVYHTQSTDLIRGHGNSTWELEKKSYNLFLGIKESLFGMGEAKKYILLSNAIDDTNLRNRLVYDFANAVGPYSGFAPECEFIDLYLNGNYAGLYLLCEKPEISETRLNLADDDILFEITGYDLGNSRQLFKLFDGMYVEIHSPNPCSTAQQEQLRGWLDSFQIKLSGSKAFPNDIDIDSWARKYLIEEVFENADAGFFSQYFFRKNQTGVVYAGPCWDYDGAIGMYSYYYPNCFLAQRTNLNAAHRNPMYGLLWQNDEFRNRVIGLYKNEYLPELNRLLNEEIPEIAERIYSASELNRIRWFDMTEDVSDSVDEMVGFLEKRVAFLNSAWIDGVEYCTLTLKQNPDAPFLYYCVPVNTDCSSLPEPYELGLDGSTWYVEENGIMFDKKTIVSSDLTLTPYVPGNKHAG